MNLENLSTKQYALPKMATRFKQRVDCHELSNDIEWARRTDEETSARR
jgi:hypothetical protein